MSWEWDEPNRTYYFDFEDDDSEPGVTLPVGRYRGAVTELACKAKGNNGEDSSLGFRLQVVGGPNEGSVVTAFYNGPMTGSRRRWTWIEMLEQLGIETEEGLGKRGAIQEAAVVGREIDFLVGHRPVPGKTKPQMDVAIVAPEAEQPAAAEPAVEPVVELALPARPTVQTARPMTAPPAAAPLLKPLPPRGGAKRVVAGSALKR